MRLRPLLVIGATLVFAARPASSQVFIGPNLEWSHWDFAEDVRSGSELSAGGYYLNPGLRLGYLFPGGFLMLSMDAGFQQEDLVDYEYTNTIVEPALAYVFLGDRTSSPYLGMTAGWHHQSFEELTRPLVGGFVGIRHRVSGGKGVIRGEFRYDHFTRAARGILPDNLMGIRIGADLLLTR